MLASYDQIKPDYTPALLFLGQRLEGSQAMLEILADHRIHAAKDSHDCPTSCRLLAPVTGLPAL